MADTRLILNEDDGVTLEDNANTKAGLYRGSNIEITRKDGKEGKGKPKGKSDYDGTVKINRSKNDANTDAEYQKAHDEKLDSEKFAKMSVEEIKRAWNAIYNTEQKQLHHKQQIIFLTLERLGINKTDWVGTTISINTCIKWFDAMKFEEIFKTGNVFISLLRDAEVRNFITSNEKYFIMMYDAYVAEVVDDYDKKYKPIRNELYTSPKIYTDQSQKEFNSELSKFNDMVNENTPDTIVKATFFRGPLKHENVELNINLLSSSKRNSDKIAKDVQEMRDDALKNMISNLPNRQLKIVKDAIKDADNSR